MKSDRTIIVGDYSQAYVHDQTVQVRADQLVHGDRIIPIPTNDTGGIVGMVKGDVYEVSWSYQRVSEWVVTAFGGGMVTWSVKPGDTFHRIVTPHDPPSCNYCIYRTEMALAEADRRGEPRSFGHKLDEYIVSQGSA